MTIRSLGDSVGGQDSTTTSTSGSSSSPRRSLDEEVLLARPLPPQQHGSDEFEDMPSLSSFRADELSTVTNTSHPSVASRTGDSRGGDCDMSIPSLSSIRLEELSTCSSFHSVQTNTNHSSDQSVEGWASFTSGNVSAETDSEEEDDVDSAEFTTPKMALQQQLLQQHQQQQKQKKGESSIDESNKQDRVDVDMSQQHRSQPPPSHGEREQPSPLNNIHTRPMSNGVAPTRSTSLKPGIVDPPPPSTLVMKRPTRRLSFPSGDYDPGNSSSNLLYPNQPQETLNDRELEVNASQPESTNGHIRLPAGRTASSSSLKRGSVERTESLPLSILQRPTKDPSGSGSSSSQTLRTGMTDGSSSSLKGGDSVPRLPRRMSTEDVDVDVAPSAARRRISDTEDDAARYSDDTSKLSDDSSDEEGSRVSDDISLNSDLESDISIDTVEDNHADVNGNALRKDSNPSGQSSSKPSEQDASMHPCVGVEQNCETVKHHPKQKDNTPPIEVTDTTPAIPPRRGSNQTTQDLNRTELQQITPAPLIQSSPSKPTSTWQNESRKPSSGRSTEGGRKKKLPPNEESGTSATDTELDEPDANEDEGSPDDKDPTKTNSRDPDGRRGKLLRNLSTSFRGLGKTASFRGALRAIGKTASKLKLRGARKQPEE